jgi:hypothetical protein
LWRDAYIDLILQRFKEKKIRWLRHAACVEEVRNAQIFWPVNRNEKTSW